MFHPNHDIVDLFFCCINSVYAHLNMMKIFTLNLCHWQKTSKWSWRAFLSDRCLQLNNNPD